jgi:2,4-dienoyl-CoA reductase-like NADH-dependent reductase (Old Yellow Enzyme family)
MSNLLEALSFTCGPDTKNRFMLAPLRNCQSHDKGVLSDEEFKWLTMRAEGNIDFLDMSLWDVFKETMEEDKQG